jgi:hypothetical protein
MPEGICIQLWHYQCSIHDPCSQNSITYLHQVAKELHHLRYFLIQPRTCLLDQLTVENSSMQPQGTLKDVWPS